MATANAVHTEGGESGGAWNGSFVSLYTRFVEAIGGRSR